MKWTKSGSLLGPAGPPGAAGPAPSSQVAPYWLQQSDPVLTVPIRQVLLLATQMMLDGRVDLDGMVVDG